jgi:hypothetical protein
VGDKAYQIFKEWFLKFEGANHFVSTTIVVVGMILTGVHQVWPYILPALDYIAGIGTFYIGWREGKEHHHG